MINEKRLVEEIDYYIREANWGEEINKVLGWCIEWIENQPKVGQWIPCSERLPDVEYISGKDPNKGHYLTCDHDGNVGVLPWCEGWNCYRHLNGSAHKDYEITDIIAWMPLPPPYKESED